jgi:Seven times multi-haem cytochrome CxxCH
MMTKRFTSYFLVCSLSVLSPLLHADKQAIPSGNIDNKSCINCHEKINPQIIKDWKTSIHASTQPVTDCISCHGKIHNNSAATARPDKTCIECHGGDKSPVVHSYTSSKHGIIMRLEKNTYDWQQPLAQANYRAPGCSYCHMHDSNHNINSLSRYSLMESKAADNNETAIRSVCQDCHAPRYITRLLVNGENMLEIARKKVREGNNLIEQASILFSESELKPARQVMDTMQHHLKNVYLGVGHQSPDYQWWHGHPALDGDLLNIKGIISELYRNKDTKAP